MFPDLTPEQVHRATAARWDLSGPLPVPHPGWMACPVCRTDVVQVRFWRFHERADTATVRGRCDVSLKCCGCAAVWIHGVALDGEAWDRRTDGRKNRLIHWRAGRRLIEEAADGVADHSS